MVYPIANGAWVTVGDVLEQVYHSLRRRTNHHDYEACGERDREKVRKAYEARYRRLRSEKAYEKEKAGGMRRVDYLRNRVRFLGLSRGRGGEGWVLNTG